MENYFQYTDSFESRHNGPDAPEVVSMLETIGVSSLDQLINETVPPHIRLEKDLQLSGSLSEFEYLKELKGVASKNKLYKSYIGMGYYDTITPPVILRNLLENPGWYTQYTPYQAEIAQGRLESLLNFQTMICDLTGFELANASLLDEGTAAGEAVALMYASRKNKDAHTIFVSESIFPQTLDVLKTRCEPLGITIEVGNVFSTDFTDSIFGVIVQYPNNLGVVESYKEVSDKAHAVGALITFCCDILALVVLTPPAELGADIAVGSAQRFGVPMGYGGPHAAYFATKDEFKRSIPGRIIGVSIDSHGNQALRMALQTREQHIKRDKATSNICTAQALLANIAAMYAVYHGPDGLQAIANRVHSLTKLFAHSLQNLGYSLVSNSFFDTLAISVSADEQSKIHKVALENEINLRYIGTNLIGVSLDETVSFDDLTALVSVFASVKNSAVPSLTSVNIDSLPQAISTELLRTDKFLTHPHFNTYHSETEMMRYLKYLENKDLSLVHSMIALGSCTMKLNAAVEMIPVTWKEFGGIHPFVPLDQATGYKEVFTNLEKALCEITGFDAISLQPNAGAQGEYAGLLVIRKYHHSRGDFHRNVVLIPSSAHGTNPASAVMAGMKVVVTKTDENGNIDVADLKEKALLYKDTLSALMVTYPSTHGVFEETIMDICAIIHENGGRVYMDGANMNAQVGLTSPRRIGADVCHLNLHKTFCIPHGGGGPGMGPIGVVADLAPFLPGHAVVPMDIADAIPAVSSAPWGSASILLISWAYIRLMGAKGLTNATKFAILNANYIKERLQPYYPALYTGSNNRIAHEMIIDLRMFKQYGIEVEDIAKRLIDYGFHAPTVSFPVPGTMMIEPTESEPKTEIDRFCDAMISIRVEIDEVISGIADAKDNVLKNAPHTAYSVISDEWDHLYSRQKAAYPLPYLKHHKFWPSVGRVNNTHGDRTLICTCPDISEYEA
jgi:glycine dehydrogenase